MKAEGKTLGLVGKKEKKKKGKGNFVSYRFHRFTKAPAAFLTHSLAPFPFLFQVPVSHAAGACCFYLFPRLSKVAIVSPYYSNTIMQVQFEYIRAGWTGSEFMFVGGSRTWDCVVVVTYSTCVYVFTCVQARILCYWTP